MPRTSGRRPDWELAGKLGAGPLGGDLHAFRLRPSAQPGRGARPGASQLSRARPRPFRPLRRRAPGARRLRPGEPVRHPQRRAGGRQEGLRHAAARRWRCCRPISRGASSISAAAKACAALQGAGARARHCRTASTWKGALAQEEVLEHYRRADLFALACRIAADGDRDGLPNVLVEASSQRLACVSTDDLRRSGTDHRRRKRSAGRRRTIRRRWPRRWSALIRDPGAAPARSATPPSGACARISTITPASASLSALFEQEWQRADERLAQRAVLCPAPARHRPSRARQPHRGGALVEDGFDVTMVTGGMPVRGFPGPGLDHVALPAVSSASEAFSGLVDADGKPVDEAFKATAPRPAARTLRDRRPDIVIIEAFPFGRRQMRFELLPLLEAIATPGPTAAARHLDPRSPAGAGEARPQRGNGRSAQSPFRPGDGAWRSGFRAPGRHVRARLARSKSRSTIPAWSPAPPPAPPRETFPTCSSRLAAARPAPSWSRATVEAARLAPDVSDWALITGPNLPQADFDAAAARSPAGTRRVPLPRGFSQPAGRRATVRLAGRLQHRLRHPAGRLPLAAGAVQRRRRDGADGARRAAGTARAGRGASRDRPDRRAALRGNQRMPWPGRSHRAPCSNLDGAQGTARLLSETAGGRRPGPANAEGLRPGRSA